VLSNSKVRDAMKIGFSLSPGGLLLPYHLGALDALEHRNVLTDDTPLAGSSAGAIAVGLRGCGISSERALECTFEISDKCQSMGGARGRLLPLLRERLKADIGQEELERINQRPGVTGIAYKQIFPVTRAYLQTEFDDQDDLVRAICFSSSFPFFSTNLPCAIDWAHGYYPRLMVDGFFTVPRDRFGCPDFEASGIDVDRTVTVSPFPQAKIGLNASSTDDCISPLVEEQGGDGRGQMSTLFRLATQASSRAELIALYESGWADAERWCRAQQSPLN
jgi:hypothetical protein